MRVHLIGAAVVALGAGFACSSSSDTSPATGAADGGADATTSEPDAAAVDAAPLDAASDDAGATGNAGGIFAISDSVTAADGGLAGTYRAGGFFEHSTGVDTTTTSKVLGPCVLETVGNGTTPDVKAFSAGTLHITGGKKPLALVPGAAATYDPVSGGESLWIGGETITVTADGKDVPAFTAKLTAPSKLTLTAPSLASLKVTRSAPPLATWTGASSGEVVLYFDIATATNAFSATCTFKASSGKAQVPAAAFADFPAGNGTFNFYVKEAAVATPPGWNIRFTASSAMVGPGGASAVGEATFN